MTTLQRFMANYSRINQGSHWGLSLGIVFFFFVTGHMSGIVRVENAAAQAEGHRANLGTSARSLPREEAPLSEQSAVPKKAPLHRICLGRKWREAGGRRRPLACPESGCGAGTGAGGGEP